jgi:hypothetical protein
LKRDEAAGVDPQGFALLQIDRVQRAGCVEEGEPIPGELLEDEAFSAEESGANAAIQRDADIDAASSAQKRILLRDERSAPVLEVDRLNLSRVRRGERDVPPYVRLVGEERDEERLARHHALARAEELAHEPASGAGGIEGRGHLDPLLHVHHRPGLGDHTFSRVQRHDHRLQVIADEPVVDHVRAHELSFEMGMYFEGR